MRVIVTRPAAQAGPWVAALRGEGFDAVALPLIMIGPVADADAVARAWAGLVQQSLVFFVSANAVQHFFARCPPDRAWPSGTLAAAPGPGTAAALRAQGLPEANIVAPPDDAPSFDSETLWAQLSGRDWQGRRVLIVRGEQGRDWLAEQLRAAGATATYLAAYERRAPVPDAAARALLDRAREAPADHLWLLSSSEAVRHLVAIWGPAVPAGARALASHPRIADAARAAGFARVDVVPPTMQAVLTALRLAEEGASVQSRTL